MCPKVSAMTKPQTMLPNIMLSPETHASATPNDSKPQSSLSANVVCQKDVVLKTIMVKLIGSKKTLAAQLLFDEGSQLSNITTETVKKIGAPLVHSEWSRSMMFGGAISDPRKVSNYQVSIQSLDNSFSTKLILRETPVICGVLPRIQIGEWMDELEKSGIRLSDTSPPEDIELQVISIQIGSDYWGSLITSAPKLLTNGMTAPNTKFGWTISGFVMNGTEILASLLKLQSI